MVLIKVESVKSMMDKIIEDNARTSSLGKVTKDAKAFWAARRSVDGDLKVRSRNFSAVSLDDLNCRTSSPVCKTFY